jgi:hypothetical protein
MSVRLTPSSGPSSDPIVFAIGSDATFLTSAVVAHEPAGRVIILALDGLTAAAVRQELEQRSLPAAGRITILVGPEYAGASGAWRPTASPHDDPPVVIDTVAQARQPDAVADAEQVVRRIIDEARANAEARRTHAGRYLLHTLANAPSIAHEGDVASLTGSFAGVPAVIVGAGPSLDGMIPELAACRTRAIVIAADTAARPMLALGAAPHFIVALDPAESNAMHLSALHNPRSAWLVAEASLHPTALAAFQGRTFFCNVSNHQPWPWLASLGLGRGQLSAWGSVATSALDLALRMGCSPVIFAGLDFAFVDSRPYCRGTTFESQWAVWMAGGQDFQGICNLLINRWPSALEPDADGHLVRTAPHLIAFRNWMRERIEAAAGVRFFNVTPGGILHHPKIELASFADVLADAPPIDSRSLEIHVRARQRARTGSSEGLARLFSAVEDLLAHEDGVRDDIRREWLEFAGGSIRAEAILSVLRSREYLAWTLGRQHVGDRITATAG